MHDQPPAARPDDSDALAMLRRARARLSITLTFATLAAYFSFILVIAFAPQWLTRPLSDRSQLTSGIVIGVGLYGFCVAVTGFYTWYARRHIDPLVRSVSGQTQARSAARSQP